MKGSDRYLVDFDGALHQDYQSALAQCYLPICGVNAIALYHVLLAEKVSNKVYEIHKLLKLSSLDIDSFQQALIALEKAELLRSYQRASEDLYLFVLASPLTVENFFHSEIYGHLFMDKVGEKTYQETYSLFVKKHFDKQDFQEITHSLDVTGQTLWDQWDQQRYDRLKFANPDEQNYVFDIRHFIRELENAILPQPLRTDDNIKAIAALGTNFAIREDDMRRFVNKAYDSNSQSFDLEKLRKQCLSARKRNLELSQDEYDSSPVAFLYHKRGNVAVARSDMEFLEKCSCVYGLKREVINALIEIVLRNQQGRFSIAYADKIASEFASLKIDSKEQAFAESEGRWKLMEKAEKKVYSLEEMDVQEASIEQLRKQMFQKG